MTSAERGRPDGYSSGRGFTQILAKERGGCVNLVMIMREEVTIVKVKLMSFVNAL